jgi:hypothetical protein
MRPDKKAIVDEVWDDARIAGFLQKPPMGDGETADFSILLNAYRSMRVEDFVRFLPVYKAAGKSVDAPNKQGQTLSEYIAPQRKAAPFIEVINRSR